MGKNDLVHNMTNIVEKTKTKTKTKQNKKISKYVDFSIISLELIFLTISAQLKSD